MQDEKPPHRVFVKHLYMSTTEHDMVEQMNYLNATEGLYNVYLVKRGQYDGNKSINAFLSYQTEDQCRAAIEILNGSYLNGLAKYPLEVDFAVPRKTGRRYYAQPPEQLEHTAEFAEGNWQQHHPQSQDDEQNQMDNQEPDLRQPQTPPKASEKTPPVAPAMPPMHHLPPRLPLPPLPPVPPFAPPRYPLMVPHGYPVPPPMLPMGYMFPPPPPVWVPPPWAIPEDWSGSAKSKAMGSKVPKAEPEGDSGEGDEELQTWLQDNLKDKVWDDGYGSVEAAESYMLEKTIKDKKQKADKTKDKKKDAKEKSEKKAAKDKDKDKDQKKKASRSRSRSKTKKEKKTKWICCDRWLSYWNWPNPESNSRADLSFGREKKRVRGSLG